MRFFGLQDKPISVDTIAGWLQTAMIDGELESEEEDYPGSWSTLTLFLDSGEPVVEIEKFSLEEETLVDAIQDTVRQLLDDKNPVRPASAVKWLCQFMTRVKVVYEFRPMQAIKTDEGWEIFNEVWTNLREALQGIVHLDDEGFTNEDGVQITWEYPGEETGDLKVAVLNDRGEEWIEYTMNLANQEHKALFLAGKAPDKNP
jgi:hypothetical protein